MTKYWKYTFVSKLFKMTRVYLKLPSTRVWNEHYQNLGDDASTICMLFRTQYCSSNRAKMKLLGPSKDQTPTRHQKTDLLAHWLILFSEKSNKYILLNKRKTKAKMFSSIKIADRSLREKFFTKLRSRYLLDVIIIL